MTGTAAPAVKAAATSTASVNVLAGAINLVENAVSSLVSSLKASTSAVTSAAVNTATNGSAIVGSVSDGEAAIADVKQAIADAKAGKWGNEPHDVIDFLKHVFAILARFGVNVPVVSSIISALPDLPAVA